MKGILKVSLLFSKRRPLVQRVHHHVQHLSEGVDRLDVDRYTAGEYYVEGLSDVARVKQHSRAPDLHDVDYPSHLDALLGGELPEERHPTEEIDRHLFELILFAVLF